MNANLMTKKIEMTKTEAKAAGKPNTGEYNTLLELMHNFPSFAIEIKAPAKRKVEFKGLTYEYMTSYIKVHDDEEKSIMNEFNILVAKEKKDGKEFSENLNAASYLDVKTWFLKKFPEIKKYRDDHKKKVQEILDKAA